MPAAPFLIVFIGGLAVGVYSMLLGVTAAPAAGAATRWGMISAPSVAAFAIAFGAIGYLCSTHTGLSYAVVVLVSFAGGAATIPVSAPLLARAAKYRSTPHPDDVTLEGQPALVIEPVSDRATGKISYERDGKSFTHPALNVIEGTLPRGRDVVIDRIEQDVAYVEDWERVEKRL
jgi:hypothetical protein